MNIEQVRDTLFELFAQGDAFALQDAIALLLQASPPFVDRREPQHLYWALFDGIFHQASLSQVHLWVLVEALYPFVEEIGTNAHKPLLQTPLYKALEHANTTAQMASAADVFRRIGDSDLEPLLLRWLRFDAPLLRMSVIQALGTCGTWRSIEPLCDFRKGVRLAKAIKRAAAHSIEQLQSRLHDAEAGGLSLSLCSTGELSLSSHARGALSVGKFG